MTTRLARLRQRVREPAERSRALPAARRLRFALAIAGVERFAERRALRELDVLDAGGGDGLLVEALGRRHRGWRIVVGDLDPERLEVGRRRVGADAGLIRFVELDLTGDLGEATYDAVLAIECLEEIPEDAAAVAAMARALRPGGLLVVHVPERDWQPLLPGSERTWRHQTRHGYTVEGLTSLLRDAGLERIAVRPVSHALVRLAQELRDRSRDRGAKVHLVLAPAAAGAAWLERRGLHIGRARALYAEAHRPSA